MAGPLAGIGQQQVPLSTPFQPGGANNGAQQVRQQNEDTTNRSNQVQGQNAPTNQTQQSETNNQQKFFVAESNTQDLSGSDGRRGSLVDIQV